MIVALLVLALAGLTLYQPTREQFVIFALDRSLSVGEESRRATEKFLDQALAHGGIPASLIWTLPLSRELSITNGPRSRRNWMTRELTWRRRSRPPPVPFPRPMFPTSFC